MTDSELDDIWAHVLSHWEDAAAHALFVEDCRQAGKLGLAAKRYRELSTPGQAGYRADAQRAEEASRRLRGIITLAMLDLESTRTSPKETGKKPGLAMSLAFLLVTVTLLAFLVRMMR